MKKTLKDIDKMIHIAGNDVDYVRTDDLRKFAEEQIKYLREQEKLHWEWVNHSIGEHPTGEMPKEFDRENSCGLPYGYKTVIRWIQKAFNLEVDKDENIERLKT